MCNILDPKGIIIEDGPIPEDCDDMQIFRVDGTPEQ